MTSRQENHRAVKIMHFAMCAGLFFITMIFVFIFKDGKIGPLEFDLDFFSIVPILISGLALFLLQPLTRKKSEGIGPDVYSEENIQSYRELKVLQWALIEGSGMINAIFYFMLGNTLHLLIAGLLLLVLWFYKPQEVGI